MLARSLHLRYREALGEDIGAFPEGHYPGDYLIPVGQKIADRDGAEWRDKPESDWLAAFRSYATAERMALIRTDREALGVQHDGFTTELSMEIQVKGLESLETLSSSHVMYQGGP